MRSDDDPEKLKMKGQTEMKHEILKKYLKPWLFKITEVSPRIRYIDGFAGPGYYDGEPGSPLIAIDAAEEASNSLSGKLQRYECIFVEKSEENFGDLVASVAEKTDGCSSNITAKCRNEEFESFARDFIDDNRSSAEPAFIFIDPFGFSGLPFEIVSELVNLRQAGIEVFITFMSGKMAQFMETDTHPKAINKILGTCDWRDSVDLDAPKDERAEQFVRVYEEQLREEAGIEYVWPFQMYEETKKQTCYYLVHATNHFDGFKLMKDIMFRAGAGERFAYLGPDHYPFETGQGSLADFGVHDESEERIEELGESLHERFLGDTLSFREIMEETYEETTLIQKHYRDACKYLAENHKAEIHNHPEEPKGTEWGLSEDDEVQFIRGTLDRFL